MEVDSLHESDGSTPANNAEDSEIPDTPETKQSSIPKPVPHLPIRKQPDVLCCCPLHCDRKICQSWRKLLYRQFHALDDHAHQNRYIQRHIKVKSIIRSVEDERTEKRVQRRVTCKYLIPTSGSVRESYRYAKDLTYDSVSNYLDTSFTQQNNFKLDRVKDSKETFHINADTTNGHNSSNGGSLMKEWLSAVASNGDPLVKELLSGVATNPAAAPKVNGVHHDSPLEDKQLDTTTTSNLTTTQKETITNVNSPFSVNDNESVNSPDEDNSSETDTSSLPNRVKYIETCQKAFMNMYGITEKRIRWQREKLILESRYWAEQQRKELEEMDRTLSLARSLGAGCQPLFAMLEKSNCTHLSEQLVIAIEDDVALVNNFFHNQLWKPEDIMQRPVRLPKLDSVEMECD